MQVSGTPPEMLSHGKRSPLPALTSLRFFAAAYIIVMHTEMPSVRSVPAAVAHFLQSGYTAVTLFFALSGFILSYNYPLIANRRDFWVSRFARIYPAYLLALVMWMALSLDHSEFRHNHLVLAATVASILLVQAWLPAIATLINPMGWTLSVEAFLYAVFPFTNPLCRRATRGGMALFAAFALTLAASPFIIAPFHRHFALNLASLMDSSPPIFRLCTFIIGSLAGTAWNRSHRQFRYLGRFSVALTLLLLCWAPGNLGHPLKTMLLSFTYSGLIYALANVKSGLLTNRWLILGGEISYSIYILQFVVFRIVNWIALRISPSLRSTTFIVGPIVLILVSWVTFRFVELPARVRIRKLLLAARPQPEG